MIAHTSSAMRGKNTDFWINKTKKVLPTHLEFQAKNKKQVDEFYKIASSSGATDNGGLGSWDYLPGYYAAFVHDRDGHNIEGVWYDPKKG